ncbi:MAG: hypothetical protein AB2812_11515 [Candidatus Sedimenticola endophacoides]
MRKFVAHVGHLTFNGAYANRRGQQVSYITERGVFRLSASGVELTEIAPGIDLRRDILEQMAFTPAIAPGLKTMDGRIFRAEPMNLASDTRWV